MAGSVASSAGLSLGAQLPDQLPTVQSALSAHLALSHDAAAFLSDRAALEREYSTKLAALTAKAAAKREKRSAEACVGAEPSKAWRREEERKSTLQAHVLMPLIDNANSAVNDHASLADTLEKVAAEMEAGTKKREEMARKHATFAARLLADRERIYSDRAKAKAKYDELCHDVDQHRARRDKAEAGDKHAERAAKQHETAEGDMGDGKNLYLIAIAKANAAKSRFYSTDLPAVQDHLQSLMTLSDRRLATSLQRAATSIAMHHESLASRSRELATSAQQVDPSDDQGLLVEYNRRRWEEPAEWSFEPCVGHFDTPEMALSPPCATYLQNRLHRARARLTALRPQLETRAREIDGLENLRDAYSRQEGLGDADEVMDNLMESLRSNLTMETEGVLHETEVQTIVEAVGDNIPDPRPHHFKPASFTIPTTCDYCSATIWGIARQGFVCKPCGFTCHSKCEMKVPADCKAAPSSTHQRTPSTVQGSVGGMSSAAPSIDRSLSTKSTATPAYGAPGSGAAMTLDRDESHKLVGRMVYAFEATSPFELTVQENDEVELLEDDSDDCGWIKVRSARGGKAGLVPTAYCDFSATGGVDGVAGAPAAATAAGSALVKALYDYAAQDDEELSLVQGEVVELTATGLEYGEGWAEGIRDGKRGIFPVSYVETV